MYVQFEDDKSRLPRQTKPTGLYGFFFRLGVIKNKTQGNILFAAIMLVCLLAILMLRDEAGLTNDITAPVIPEDSQKAGNPSEVDNSL